MMWLKSCPRCETGDMFLDGDQYGMFRQCIQCSHIQDLVHKSEVAAGAQNAFTGSRESIASLMVGLSEAS